VSFIGFEHVGVTLYNHMRY